MTKQFNGIGTRVDLTPGLQQVLKVYAATNGRCTNCLSPVTLEKAHFIAAATCQILCPLCSMIMRVFCAFPETDVDAMEHLVNKAVFEVTGRVPPPEESLTEEQLFEISEIVIAELSLSKQ